MSFNPFNTTKNAKGSNSPDGGNASGVSAANKSLPDRDEAAAIGDIMEDYIIDLLDDSPIGVDPEVNARLSKAGFSNEQAQLVYDLAVEKLTPIVQALYGDDANQEDDMAALEEHFGGKERWERIRPQLQRWGQANLPEEICRFLGESPEGIKTLHYIMGTSKNEPDTLGRGTVQQTALNEKQLKRMMEDPRYWKQRDSAYIAKVRRGFEALYPPS